MTAIEIGMAYGTALRAAWAPALVALAAAGALALARRRAPVAASSPQAARALAAAGVALALAWAVHLAWVCDDAFISFRYADNLAAGRGLVWNVGERVEGYTNFLWTALLAGTIRLGLPPGQTAIALGLGAFVLALLLAARLGRVLAPGSRLPLAAIALGAHYTFASFATSGLETMAAAACVLLALERAIASAPLSSGLAGIAATMLHPDHAIFYVALGLAQALEPPGPARRRALIRYALPLGAIYLPYFALRFAYYGQPLPNTFYAKSGGGSHFGQGLTYLFAGFLGGGLWAVAPFAVLGARALRGTLAVRFILIALPVYLIYVAKIGGDYMYGRLWVVALPLVLLLAQAGWAALSGTWRCGALVALAIAALPTPPVAPRAVRWQIADERTHTPVASFFPLQIDSPMFRRAGWLRDRLAPRGLAPRVADTEIGMLGYYTKLEVIDFHGLTDATVARQPLAARGRPGHEKLADRGYLRARGVELSRGRLFPERFASATRVKLPDGGTYHFGAWRPALAEALDGARFTPAPGYIDDYLARADAPAGPAGAGGPGALGADLESDVREFFEPYYFSQECDRERRARFVDRLRAAGAVALAATLAAGGPCR